VGRIEKTVFVSYRRADEPWALAVFENLTQHGYDVFIDYDGIASGSFETVILENIRARAHFLVLLTPTALERCRDPKDWMRREIEVALDNQRNIVPLMLAGFDFGTPAIASQLTGKLAALKEYNGLVIPKGYFSPAMERLRNKFLSVSLDTVLHPASLPAQKVAKEQKDKAVTAYATLPHFWKDKDRQTKFTAGNIERIKEWVAQGVGRDEIASRLKVSVRSLQVTCSRLGISLRKFPDKEMASDSAQQVAKEQKDKAVGRQPRKFTPETIGRIKEWVAQGVGREEIAARLEMSVGSLQVTCSRLGISLRKPKVG
jgi:DNA-binding CsgD family transcriptional regulator